MKEKKSMLILAAILAALAAIYGGIRMYNQAAEKERQKEEKASQTDVVSFQTDELVSLSYTNGQSDMNFVKDEDTWYLEEDLDIDLAQDSVESTLDTLGTVQAVRELKKPDSPADYGLDEPAYTIEYQTEDSDCILYIGDAAGENYYAMVEGEKTVYTVSADLVAALQFEVSQFARNDTVPSISSGNLKKVEVTQNGEMKVFEDEEELAELAGGFGTLTLTECVDYHADESGMGAYGLDEASQTVVSAVYKDAKSGEKETFTVCIGTQDEDGTKRYLRVKDSKRVYAVSKDIIENMMTADTGDTEES